MELQMSHYKHLCIAYMSIVVVHIENIDYKMKMSSLIQNILVNQQVPKYMIY